MKRINAMLPPDLLSDDSFCRSWDEYNAAHAKELAEKADADLKRFLSGSGSHGSVKPQPNR